MDNINKIENLDYTIFRYIDQKRKNAQSTRVKKKKENIKLTLSLHVRNKTNEFIHTISKFENTMYTDQTRKFKYRSKREHNYIFLTYCYDTNSILVILLKSKKGLELVEKLE